MPRHRTCCVPSLPAADKAWRGRLSHEPGVVRALACVLCARCCQGADALLWWLSLPRSVRHPPATTCSSFWCAAGAKRAHLPTRCTDTACAASAHRRQRRREVVLASPFRGASKAPSVAGDGSALLTRPDHAAGRHVHGKLHQHYRCGLCACPGTRRFPLSALSGRVRPAHGAERRFWRGVLVLRGLSGSGQHDRRRGSGVSAPCAGLCVWGLRVGFPNAYTPSAFRRARLRR